MTHDMRRARPGDLRRLIRLITLGLAVVALVKELRTPAEEREWNGIVVGFVPYDFRMPTAERIQERFWDPEAEHVIGPRVFGVGWTLNLGRLVELVRRHLAS